MATEGLRRRRGLWLGHSAVLLAEQVLAEGGVLGICDIVPAVNITLHLVCILLVQRNLHFSLCRGGRSYSAAQLDVKCNSLNKKAVIR